MTRRLVSWVMEKGIFELGTLETDPAVPGVSEGQPEAEERRQARGTAAAAGNSCGAGNEAATPGLFFFFFCSCSQWANAGRFSTGAVIASSPVRRLRAAVSARVPWAEARPGSYAGSSATKPGWIEAAAAAGVESKSGNGVTGVPISSCASMTNSPVAVAVPAPVPAIVSEPEPKNFSGPASGPSPTLLKWVSTPAAAWTRLLGGRGTGNSIWHDDSAATTASTSLPSASSVARNESILCANNHVLQ
jgi:hypothetical protein